MRYLAYAAAAATPLNGASARTRRPARSRPLPLRAWTAALMLILGAAALFDIGVDAGVRSVVVAQWQLP